MDIEATARKLELIANAITHTVYDHGIMISNGYRPERCVNWDDADYLRQTAKEMRGPGGQLAHELSRKTLPW